MIRFEEKSDLELGYRTLQQWLNFYNNPCDTIGYEYCAFCLKYHTNYAGCCGCPVQEFTKQPYCRGTPYYVCATAIATNSPKRKNLIEEEYKFLASIVLDLHDE